MTESEKLTEIAKILKKRFPNLPFEETLDLAQKILDKVNER